MFSIHILLPRQTPIYWAKPSIPHSTMKEHPDIVKFCHFSAYVRTRSAGILRGLTPWHTDFGTKSSVLHLVRGVQAPGTHVRSDYSQTRHIGGRPSSHKANLIPQSKRQDTTIIVIPCLCSFTVPSSPFAEPPVNKKRTRTLFRKESGSSTNCMVGGTGLEQQRRRPPPAAETGSRGWDSVLIFQSPAKGLRKNQQTQPVQAPAVRFRQGSQRLGMSTKKDAARPFGLGTFFVVDGTGREPERAKAGYHHDGGILPFALICFISRSQHPLQYSLRENSP